MASAGRSNALSNRTKQAKENGRKYRWNKILALQFQNGQVESYCLDWEADKTTKLAYPSGCVKRSCMPNFETN